MRILVATNSSAIAAQLGAALDRCSHAWQSLHAVAQLPLDDLGAAELRERLRRELDRAVASFDPQLIHAEGLTFWGQLASETGVPYVVTLGADDLRHGEDSRLRELAEQGAENARRVIVPADLEAASKAWLGEFENIVTARWWPDDLGPLEGIYLAAIDRRS